VRIRQPLTPANPALVVQTGSQRSEGIELSASGNLTSSWQVIGSAAFQRAEIMSTTNAAAAGQKVPLVPERTFSLWRTVPADSPLSVPELGVIHQADMLAAIDNTVTLPGFTRLDAALYAQSQLIARRAQINVENLLDEQYYATSHGNNNIMPGAPRTIRFS
jgi:catecholate siderophore receptor